DPRARPGLRCSPWCQGCLTGRTLSSNPDGWNKYAVARLPTDMAIELGTFGIWRGATELDPRLAADVEKLGYGAIWIGGSPGGKLETVSSLLDATDHIVVATGIVNMWKDDAATIAAAYHEIAQRHPDRFLLGVGIGHPEATKEYAKPYDTMVRYL